MPKTSPNMHAGHAAAGDDVRRAEAAPAEEAFPPLTISLEAFVKDGSDREFRELVFDLTALHNQMQLHVDLFARHIGTTNAQFHVIMALARKPDLTVSQLAELMNVAGPIITIEIGSLVRKGIVERQSNENNRRASILNLTAKGRDLVREVAPLLRRVNDRHFRSMSADQARAVRESLRAIVADGRNVIEELDAPDMAYAKAAAAQPEP